TRLRVDGNRDRRTVRRRLVDGSPGLLEGSRELRARFLPDRLEVRRRLPPRGTGAAADGRVEVDLPGVDAAVPHAVVDASVVDSGDREDLGEPVGVGVRADVLELVDDGRPRILRAGVLQHPRAAAFDASGEDAVADDERGVFPVVALAVG